MGFPLKSCLNYTSGLILGSIVAIHGLDTQAPRTWVAWRDEGNRDFGETHWLKDVDMLPSIIPNARIFTFDWNANLDSDAADEDLLGFADSLLDELYRLRHKVSFQSSL